MIITGNDGILLKCDFPDGCCVNGIRQPISYTYDLDNFAQQKITKKVDKNSKNKKTNLFGKRTFFV